MQHGLLISKVCIVNLWFVEFSYTDAFSEYVFIFLVIFKILQMFIDVFLSHALKDTLLVSPLIVSITLTEFLVTMGADNFQVCT